MISTSDLHKGVVIELDGDLWQILDYHHLKIGRGSAQVRIKLRNVKRGATVERSFQAGDRWLVYYDKYNKGGYGAVETRDFVTFTPVQTSLPKGIRHGTIVGVDAAPELLRRRLRMGRAVAAGTRSSGWPAHGDLPAADGVLPGARQR